MSNPIDYLEVIKYLNKDKYYSNPPDFNNLLIRFEQFNPVFNQDNFLGEDENSKIFLSYLFVKFNWVMHQVAMGNPDLAELTNLQIQVESIKEKFSNPMTNYYVNILYTMLSSVALYFSDKSIEAVSEFNLSLASILSQTSKWWVHDYNYEYMQSKAPQKILDMKVKSSEKCNNKNCECKSNA